VGNETAAKPGLIIAEVPEDEFRLFARRNASSPEIGPIRTCVDSDAGPSTESERMVVGLRACDKLLAAASLQFFDSEREPDARVLKLDSIIVDPGMRRRGLGAILVGFYFGEIVTRSVKRISRIYAHSVHPATVRMLKRLGFGDPPPASAPITDISIDPEAREAFVRACESGVRGRLNQMRLQCEFCRKGDRRARPWCQPN